MGTAELAGITSGLPPTCGQDCECESRALAPTDPRARRWAWWLTGATIGWNSLEAVIAMVGGILAGSIALMGFGLDSMVEVASAVVIVWRSRPGRSLSSGRQVAPASMLIWKTSWPAR